MRQSRDFISGEPYSIEDLRAMVFEDRGPLDRPLALTLLGQRVYEGRIGDLERILMDDSEVPRLRHQAARFLGEIEAPEAERALERGAEIRDELVVRGVIEGLSAVGGDHARQRLEELGRRHGAVGEAARGAALLLSHRQGATDAEPFSAVKEKRAPVPRGSAVPIEVAPADPKEVDDAVTALTSVTRSLPLTRQGALSFQCEGNPFYLLFTEPVLEGGVDTFTSHPTQAGIVCRRQSLEGSAWELWYHVLTHPQTDNRVDILVTTPKNLDELVGTARVKGSRAEFELWALERPGALPIEVSGFYDGATVTITSARSALRRLPSLLASTNES
jgi:hypothetical protein